MNPIILPPAIEATSQGEGKLWIQTLKIDLVSYPARAEGLGK